MMMSMATRRAQKHKWLVKRQQAKRYVKRYDPELYSWIVNRYYKKGCRSWRNRECILTSYERMEYELDHLLAQQVADIDMALATGEISPGCRTTEELYLPNDPYLMHYRVH